jgi:transcriptional regulator with XRE-family HTH domain
MKLSEYLDREGLSQAAFAERSGLSTGTVSMLARGKTWLSRVAAHRIEKASGGEVTASDFVHVEAAE